MKWFLFLSSFAFFCLLAAFSKNKIDSKKEAQAIHVPPPKNLEYFSFGYRDSIADSLWIRWIQDMEVCGKPKIKRKEFDKKYGIKNLGLKVGKVKVDYLKKDVCDKGWSYLMLDAITDLSPRFEIPYSAGGNSLSVIVDDHEGARLIYEKGLKLLKDNWRIRFVAAYLYLYELQTPKKAAELLFEAAKKGAPSWTYSLASRLFKKTGQIELGIISLTNHLKNVKDEKQKKEIVERIENLKRAYQKSE